MTNAFTNDKGSLEERVNLFNRMALPGQPLGMHMGTSYLVNDLMREIQELREALKPFAEAHKQLEHMPSNAKPEHGLLSSDRRLFSKDELAHARAKLEGSGK